MRSGSAGTKALLAAALVCAAWQPSPSSAADLAAQRANYPDIPLAAPLSPELFANHVQRSRGRRGRLDSGPGNGSVGGAPSSGATAAGVQLAAAEDAPQPVEDPLESPAPAVKKSKSSTPGSATNPSARRQQGTTTDGAATGASPEASALAPLSETSAPATNLPGGNPNPPFDPRFPGDPGPLNDDTSIINGIHDFFSGRTFPTEGGPAYTVSATALILHRSEAKSTPLVANGAGGTLLDAGGLAMGFAVGPRIDVTMHFASGYNFEVIFYGLDGWHSQSQLSAGPNGLQVPIFAADRFSNVHTEYSSRLFNEEINSKHELWGPINILSGFRAVQVNENLNLAGTGPTTNGSGNLKTRNWLLGLQVGLEGALVERGPVSLDCFIKGGVYINPARVTTNQSGNVTLPSGSDYDAHEAFVGDAGVNLNYRFPRDWTATVGYQALWMDRLALAPNQSATIPTVNFHGDVFLTGVQIGLVKPF